MDANMKSVKPQIHLREKQTELNHSRAIKFALIYIFVGCLWVFSTDTILALFAPESSSLIAGQAVKGVIYVLGTAVIVYWLSGKAFYKIQAKTLADQLDEVEHLLDVVMSNLDQAILIVYPHRHIRSCNEKVKKIFGYEMNELIGNSTEILHVDHDHYERFGEMSQPFLEQKGVFRSTYQMKRKDGTIIDTRITVFNIHERCGWQRGVVSIIDDISDVTRNQEVLKKSEEQYRLLAENTLDVIWAMDMDYRFTYVNPAVEKVIGYTQEKFIDSNLRDHCTSEVFFELQKIIEKEVARKYSDEGSIIRTEIVHKDGSSIPVEARFKVLYDEQYSKPIGLQGTAHNISGRLRLELQLRQAQKMEAIGTLAGGIAHDFNNILGAILGYSDLALEDCKQDPDVQNNIEQVIKAGNRARELVSQILSFSRQHETEPIRFRPASIIKEAIKLIRSTLPTNITVNQNIKDVSEILADPNQMHQIVVNLCTNAYHSLEDAGGSISVILEEEFMTFEDLDSIPEVGPGNYACLHVGDTGTGIAPDVLERIFDPYFTTKESGKGTGMGLAVVHGIVKDFGGIIEVKSEIGKGSDFKVCFPVAKGVGEADSTHQEPELRIGSEHILLIDDEKMLADLMETMLHRLGYEVTSQTDSHEALEVFRKQPESFDLVITDQAMPGMTGLEISRRLLEIRSDIPIIICTGYSDKISKVKAESLGIKEFVMKPVDKNTISRVIRDALGT